MRLIIEVKNPTEELTGHILFTLVVGYFACAQYDVFFIPYRRVAPLPPKEEANYRLCERSEAISREGGGLRSIFSVLFQGDCRGHFVPRNDNE